jgi:heme exporter protein D
MNALKTFFVWLLLSVVPLQGMAVNTIMSCKAILQNLQLMRKAGSCT